MVFELLAGFVKFCWMMVFNTLAAVLMVFAVVFLWAVIYVLVWYDVPEHIWKRKE